jgi:hypothetical protein
MGFFYPSTGAASLQGINHWDGYGFLMLILMLRAIGSWSVSSYFGGVFFLFFFFFTVTPLPFCYSRRVRAYTWADDGWS